MCRFDGEVSKGLLRPAIEPKQASVAFASTNEREERHTQPPHKTELMLDASREICMI